jgi:hypothetical protein
MIQTATGCGSARTHRQEPNNPAPTDRARPVSLQSSAEQMNFSEPLLSRHPWLAALLLGTVATPAGVVLAWLAPRPLDAVVALPLVLVDVWAASGWATGTAETPSNQAPTLRLLLLVLGILLTWVFYVLAARLLLWRLLPRAGDEVESD